MRYGLKARLLADLAGVAGLLLLSPVAAFSQTPFYQGKTIALLQSTQAGDTSDTMTRAIVPFLKKHIPGEPTIKLEFMSGSGGTKAANHIFSNVRPDGLTIGRIGGGLVANAVLREAGVRYDLNNKLVGEEPTPVMPEEMERLVKDLPRDSEIVELFKKTNAADPLPPR